MDWGSFFVGAISGIAFIILVIFLLAGYGAASCPYNRGWGQWD